MRQKLKFSKRRWIVLAYTAGILFFAFSLRDHTCQNAHAKDLASCADCVEPKSNSTGPFSLFLKRIKEIGRRLISGISIEELEKQNDALTANLDTENKRLDQSLLQLPPEAREQARKKSPSTAKIETIQKAIEKNRRLIAQLEQAKASQESPKQQTSGDLSQQNKSQPAEGSSSLAPIAKHKSENPTGANSATENNDAVPQNNQLSSNEASSIPSNRETNVLKDFQKSQIEQNLAQIAQQTEQLALVDDALKSKSLFTQREIEQLKTARKAYEVRIEAYKANSKARMKLSKEWVKLDNRENAFTDARAKLAASGKDFENNLPKKLQKEEIELQAKQADLLAQQDLLNQQRDKFSRTEALPTAVQLKQSAFNSDKAKTEQEDRLRYFETIKQSWEKLHKEMEESPSSATSRRYLAKRYQIFLQQKKIAEVNVKKFSEWAVKNEKQKSIVNKLRREEAELEEENQRTVQRVSSLSGDKNNPEYIRFKSLMQKLSRLKKRNQEELKREEETLERTTDATRKAEDEMIKTARDVKPPDIKI